MPRAIKRKEYPLSMRLHDTYAAKAAGMDSGAVAWGYAIPSALQAAGPTHLFNSIEEMLQRLSAAK